MKANIYTDGAAKGNPGPGGYGTIVDIEGVGSTEYSGGYRLTTNNRMELMAVIVGLESLKEPSTVIVTSDSKYLVDAFNQNWIPNWIRRGWRTSSGSAVKNIDLWQRLLKAKEGHNVRFIWVRGHAGHPLNERCDYLASTASMSTDLQEDTNYAG